MIRISLTIEWLPSRRSQKLQKTANMTQSYASCLQQARILRRGIEMKIEEVLGINTFEFRSGKGLEMQLIF